MLLWVYIGATAGQAAVTPVYQLRLQEQFSRVCAHGADARVRIPTSDGRTQGVRNTGEHTGPTCPRGPCESPRQPLARKARPGSRHQGQARARRWDGPQQDTKEEKGKSGKNIPE